MYPAISCVVFLVLAADFSSVIAHESSSEFGALCANSSRSFLIDDSCFIISLERKTFLEASVSCNALHRGRLANLKTSAQAERLLSEVKNSPEAENLLSVYLIIGIARPATITATSLKDGWRYVDGNGTTTDEDATVFTNDAWDKTQPDGVKGLEDETRIRFDQFCGKPLLHDFATKSDQFICEYLAPPTTTTSTTTTTTTTTTTSTTTTTTTPVPTTTAKTTNATTKPATIPSTPVTALTTAAKNNTGGGKATSMSSKAGSYGWLVPLVVVLCALVVVAVGGFVYKRRAGTFRYDSLGQLRLT